MKDTRPLLLYDCGYTLTGGERGRAAPRLETFMTISEHAAALLRILETAGSPDEARERVEEELRRALGDGRTSDAQVHTWKHIIDNAEWGIATADASTNRFDLVNPAFARMHGYLVEELQGAAVADVFAPEHRDELPNRMERVGREGRHVFEATHVDKRGQRFPVLVDVTAIRDASGRARYWATHVQDITESKRQEEALQRFEEQVRHTQKLESLGVLAGGIAHDFNNLLVGILGNAELLLLKHGLGPSDRDVVERIRTASLRASELTAQMLAYSGRGRFLAVPVRMDELVREMVGLLEASISKKATLELDFETELPSIEVDPSQIRQVVMNLITNASDALGGEGGTIRLRTGITYVDREFLARTYLAEDLPEGRYVFLEVQDDGMGMDDATLAKIFDPFFTTKFAGRGLGLAAALGIVRGHKGAIRVQSAPGRGSTFTLLFPASRRRAVPSVSPASRPPDWAGRGTVLVVDDEEGVRGVTRRMLQRVGLSVLTAREGREAVEVFRRHADELSLVVLDLMMPGLNGEEAFHEMQKIRPEVPVIMTSGYHDWDASDRVDSLGLAGFLRKPYEAHQLVEMVRRAIEGEVPGSD